MSTADLSNILHPIYYDPNPFTPLDANDRVLLKPMNIMPIHWHVDQATQTDDCPPIDSLMVLPDPWVPTNRPLVQDLPPRCSTCTPTPCTYHRYHSCPPKGHPSLAPDTPKTPFTHQYSSRSEWDQTREARKAYHYQAANKIRPGTYVWCPSCHFEVLAEGHEDHCGRSVAAPIHLDG